MDTVNASLTVCECGLIPKLGQPSCETQRDELLARDYEQPALYWPSHRLAVDAYCLQHASYVASAKSLAAHLCGLCVAFEKNNDAELLRRLQHWLSTNPEIVKPKLPASCGELNISHVYGISHPTAFRQAVTEWAASVWDAYQTLHATARHWLSLVRR